MIPSDAPTRHDFVWLGPSWREGLLAGLREEALVARWVGDGHPLIVARSQPGDAPGALRLGLATPDKRRIALYIERDAIVRHAPPPLLADLPVPPSWRPTVGGVSALGHPARVYGSLAWAGMTGLDYVRPDRSDLDLLFTPADAAALQGLLAGLRPLAVRAQPRLDGEILLPGGRAVAWREWLGGGQVLVKAADQVYLAESAALEREMWGMAA
ncbi:malonate decarboxylase holo-[acyl-carrier-protein] synthase [Niveispirillum irakense]|uniref:malonate decarboxylase holo-[acyl-carrier-protein] synthase n=1 Tax=Niveispirillum irakense TaxID=34011 RepID=UPI000405D089|nr:malonate decarboxylase holo-[acyl-carrier-protein] synthase [Niveispirillum irakense]